MGWGKSIIVYNVGHKIFINILPGAGILSRIIKTESAGKDRNRLSKGNCSGNPGIIKEAATG